MSKSKRTRHGFHPTTMEDPRGYYHNGAALGPKQGRHGATHSDTLDILRSCEWPPRLQLTEVLGCLLAWSDSSRNSKHNHAWKRYEGACPDKERRSLATEKPPKETEKNKKNLLSECKGPFSEQLSEFWGILRATLGIALTT